MAWLELSLALVLFFASHRLPVAFGIKAAFANRGALRAYYALYSALSLGLLWWLIVAAGRAPLVPLWDHALWHRWAVNLAMPAACLLAAFGIAAPNPFAFEGKRTGFAPEAPGIAGLTRQPLLWALALWSGAHLLANGDLAHALLFGPFFAFALLGMLALDRRNRRALPPEASAHTQASCPPLPSSPAAGAPATCPLSRASPSASPLGLRFSTSTRPSSASAPSPSERTPCKPSSSTSTEP